MHIKSGDVYVYEESRSAIKRWTEGRMWTPSRILGQFLIYREADKDKEIKSDGLIKKTISFQVTLPGESRKEQWHVVAYYSECDLEFGCLDTPSTTPELKNLKPREAIGMFPLGRKKDCPEEYVEYPLRHSSSSQSNDTTLSFPDTNTIVSPWMHCQIDQQSYQLEQPFMIDTNDPTLSLDYYLNPSFGWTPTPELENFLEAIAQPVNPEELFKLESEQSEM
jgi:hypothetical protein